MLAAAGALGPPLPTPLGALELDASQLLTTWLSQVGAERYSTEPLAIPSDPALVGFQLALQALGTGTGAGLSLSDAALVTKRAGCSAARLPFLRPIGLRTASMI